LLAMGHTLAVQPCFVIEADGVDNKSIAIPFRDGLSHPQWLQILGMSASVEKQLPITVHVSFVQNNHERGSLYELLWKRRDSGNSGGKAMAFGVVFAQIGTALLVQRFCPRL